MESLFDNVRSGNLTFDGEINDIVLESVDTLKMMTEEVRKSCDTGEAPCFEDIDIDRLVETIKTTGKTGGEKTFLGKVLVETGAITERELRESLRTQKKDPEKKLGEILVKGKKITPEEVRLALKTQMAAKRTAHLQVKVDTEKLDHLVNLAGELSIAQSIFKRIGIKMTEDNQAYTQQFNQINQTISSIQKTAMSMRMVPIKNTFQKMFRLVRDLARDSGKEVDLITSGEDERRMFIR